MSSAPWIIVGTGALGSILGARLLTHTPVYFIPRQASAKIQLKVTGHTVFEGTLPLVSPAQVLHQVPAQAIWVFAVKAWQLESALQAYQAQLAHSQAIIISHNGLGAAEPLIQQFPTHQVFDWVTTQGGYRVASPSPAATSHLQPVSYQVVHSGLGESWLGYRSNNSRATDSRAINESTASPQSEPPAWYPVFKQALPPCEWESNIQVKRWEKLAINCVINARAALAGQTNGWLAQAHLQAELQAISYEVALIMCRVLQLEHPSKLASRLYQMASKVIQQTAENKNSMLQDLQAKRPTEIAFLNGFIHKKGQQFKIATPLNSRLYQQVQARELLY